MLNHFFYNEWIDILVDIWIYVLVDVLIDIWINILVDIWIDILIASNNTSSQKKELKKGKSWQDPLLIINAFP